LRKVSASVNLTLKASNKQTPNILLSIYQRTVKILCNFNSF
jgi:hypothetical protein